LKQKYGDSVTYEEDRLAHVKTKFGFDVLEVRMDVTLRIVTMTSSALEFPLLYWNKPFRKPTA
jgi:hypothetical protein